MKEKYDVRILRDCWGVPHVYGKKDTDVAFGLAYAHAQDDFKTMQLIMAAVDGRLASVLGRKGAGNDFLVHLIRLWDTVNAKYGTDLSPETRALCEAYAEGINYYAALHPGEALKGLYPIGGKHIVAGFVHKMPLMVGVDKVLKELFAEKKPADRKAVLSRGDTLLGAAFQSDAFTLVTPRTGSNGLAVSPRRSAGGHTLLAVNSHQPWEGPVSWYEAHLHSEEGLNVVGGIFPGAPVVLHGHNEHLGWAHTNNYPDLIDVYELKINPENPGQYRYDGKWVDLETRQAPIKVKILGPISWTVKREVLWSVYGPTVRRPDGVYAIRYAGMGEVRQVEQWYRMDRARTMAEWEKAVAMATLPMFNCTYADGKGNILYLYQALLPVRDGSYDWKKNLPGDTPRTLWTSYLPHDRLPRVKNPRSGFVQNCNNTPYRTTLDPENPRRADYAPAFGIEEKMTNRAMRALELFDADPSITLEEFNTYKYDMAYSKKSKMAKLVKRILATAPGDDTVGKEALAVLKTWDLKTDPDNRGAAAGVLAFTLILGPEGGKDPDKVSDGELKEGFIKAAGILRKRHGRLDPPWREVNRLIRGDVDLGLGGGPDVLHAVRGDLGKDGRLKGVTGDSYVLLVRWDRHGRVRSESVHVYGSATINKKSPHYADQSPLFVQRKLKPVWMNEKDIRANLEREYFPGEEK